MHTINQKKLFVLVAVILLVLGYAIWSVARHRATPPDSQIDTSSWLSFTDPASHVEFRYPPKIDTAFIAPVDWPPQVRIVDELFTCTEAGLETARAGITKKNTIHGTEYCVTQESEGAAGSTYTSYAYAKAQEGKTLIFTFTLRFPQCLNYDEPKSSACTAERTSFDMDFIVDGMMRTATEKALARI